MNMHTPLIKWRGKLAEKRNEMAEKSWLKKIGALKRLLREVGSIWPSPSTKLAGYAENGPYHCEDCKYLKRDENGNPIKDQDGKGRCDQPMMIADTEVKHDSRGLALVNIEHGCCEFVDPPKHEEEEKKS